MTQRMTNAIPVAVGRLSAVGGACVRRRGLRAEKREEEERSGNQEAEEWFKRLCRESVTTCNKMSSKASK